MSLHETPLANRVHIGLFGRRNAGKSSLINALSGQEVAIVSALPGTTTDPVSKAMELLPLGPVVLVDTAGLDDDTELGAQRVKKTLQTLEKIDIALLVVDARLPLGAAEQELLQAFAARGIAHLLVYNKSDLLPAAARPALGEADMLVSAASGENIHALRERIAALRPPALTPYPLLADLIAPGDTVLLVTPQDSAAPQGRLILPQQQTIRALLDHRAQALICQETELPQALDSLKTPPRLVITDSQVFAAVAALLPPHTPLTSFSILFARHKGLLEQALRGVAVLDVLCDGDALLIAEGCSHHRQCEDIGTVKLPRWLRAYSGKELRFDFCSGQDFPADLQPYRLIIHCGACMLPPRLLQYRLRQAERQGVPLTNYGILIAYINGILQRSLQPLQG